MIPNITTDQGIAGVCVLLTMNVLFKVGDFLWRIKKEKDSFSESAIRDLTAAVQLSTKATQHLDLRMQCLEKAASDLPKFKTDIRRFYAAVKELAGEDWPRIRDEIMKDELTQ